MNRVQSAKSAYCVVLSILLLCTEISSAATWQWISGAQLQSRLKEGGSPWLIDVRGGVDYDAVHVEGSVNIPEKLLAHKKFPAQKVLILMDDSLGQRTAREAADALVQKGQERVFVLEGGAAVWKKEGLPIAEKKSIVRGVNAGDLKWALVQSVPLKLYDLRDAKEQKLGSIKNSEMAPGNTISERIENLKAILASGEKGGDLTSRMKKPLPMVLVFSAATDAEGYMRKLMLTTKTDIRYLIGGYEAMNADTARGTRTTGACPTCPREGK